MITHHFFHCHFFECGEEPNIFNFLLDKLVKWIKGWSISLFVVKNLFLFILNSIFLFWLEHKVFLFWTYKQFADLKLELIFKEILVFLLSFSNISSLFLSFIELLLLSSISNNSSLSFIKLLLFLMWVWLLLFEFFIILPFDSLLIDNLFSLISAVGLIDISAFFIVFWLKRK